MVSAVSYTYDQGTDGAKHRTSMSDDESGSTSWGLAGDIHVPGDYDAMELGISTGVTLPPQAVGCT